LPIVGAYDFVEIYDEICESGVPSRNRDQIVAQGMLEWMAIVTRGRGAVGSYHPTSRSPNSGENPYETIVTLIANMVGR